MEFPSFLIYGVKVMYKKVVIGSTERGVLYRDKQFVSLLGPGMYRFLSLTKKFSVEVFDIVKHPELAGGIARVILKENPKKYEQWLFKVSIPSREVGVLYRDGVAFTLLAPGDERLFWRGLAELDVSRFDIRDDFEVPSEVLKDVATVARESELLDLKVPEQCRGILFEAGVIRRELVPGRYGFFRAKRDLSSVVLDTRVSAMEVSGQEMLTKDKVSLRVNVTVAYAVCDVSLAVRSVSDISGEIYRTVQLAIRQAVGEKTLDELLENKEALNKGLLKDVVDFLSAFGVRVSRVGVKDIILPGDMRTLMNQVVEAEKAAQAQNIRRREETAATRSLLNTARMMEDNPVLLRLKELEAVERISSKVEKLTVYDGLKGVMNGLVSLGTEK